jgi:hypothetical protein
MNFAKLNNYKAIFEFNNIAALSLTFSIEFDYLQGMTFLFCDSVVEVSLDDNLSVVRYFTIHLASLKPFHNSPNLVLKSAFANFKYLALDAHCIKNYI